MLCAQGSSMKDVRLDSAKVISQKKKTSSVQIPVRLFVCLLVFACLCMSVGLSVGMVNPAVMNVMIVVTGVSWNC